MYAVVVKPFTAYGVPYNPGDLLDTSDFPKGDVLKRTRYIRDASVDEVQKATGMELPAAPVASSIKTKSPASNRPAKAGKPKVVTASALPPPSSSVPLRQSRQARAKAAHR